MKIPLKFYHILTSKTVVIHLLAFSRRQWRSKFENKLVPDVSMFYVTAITCQVVFVRRYAAKHWFSIDRCVRKRSWGSNVLISTWSVAGLLKQNLNIRIRKLFG